MHQFGIFFPEENPLPLRTRYRRRAHIVNLRKTGHNTSGNAVRRWVSKNEYSPVTPRLDWPLWRPSSPTRRKQRRVSGRWEVTGICGNLTLGKEISSRGTRGPFWVPDWELGCFCPGRTFRKLVRGRVNWEKDRGTCACTILEEDAILAPAGMGVHVNICSVRRVSRLHTRQAGLWIRSRTWTEFCSSSTLTESKNGAFKRILRQTEFKKV